MPDQPRPVWLTREQRDLLAGISGRTPAPAKYAVNQIIYAWDAAPADAIAVGVDVADNTGYMSEDFVPAIARAWGMPDA